MKDLRLTLDREGFTTQQLNTALYELTNEEIMADIISLIRRYAIDQRLLVMKHVFTELLRNLEKT